MAERTSGKESYLMNGTLEVPEALHACLAASARGEIQLKVYLFDRGEQPNNGPRFQIRVPLNELKRPEERRR